MSSPRQAPLPRSLITSCAGRSILSCTQCCQVIFHFLLCLPFKHPFLIKTERFSNITCVSFTNLQNRLFLIILISECYRICCIAFSFCKCSALKAHHVDRFWHNNTYMSSLFHVLKAITTWNLVQREHVSEEIITQVVVSEIWDEHFHIIRAPLPSNCIFEFYKFVCFYCRTIHLQSFENVNFMQTKPSLEEPWLHGWDVPGNRLMLVHMCALVQMHCMALNWQKMLKGLLLTRFNIWICRILRNFLCQNQTSETTISLVATRGVAQCPLQWV